MQYQVTAILHDVLENTDATEEEVAKFGPDILIAVRLLTKKPEQDEFDYVQKILGNHIASVLTPPTVETVGFLSEAQVLPMVYAYIITGIKHPFNAMPCGIIA